MALAIFDLDHTLICADSDYLWGRFLIQRGLVDGEQYQRHNDRFYAEYKNGTLDIDEFLRFSLNPLTQHSIDQLHQWREEFVKEYINPVVAEGTASLLQQHRDQGDELLIITATNAFITRPIAELLNVQHLLATEPEIRAQRYTGHYHGIPTFQAGKVINLQLWLEAHDQTLEESYFYSDSHNDLPLLERVTHPVVVHADETLQSIATEKGWPSINLCHQALQ